MLPESVCLLSCEKKDMLWKLARMVESSREKAFVLLCWECGKECLVIEKATVFLPGR